MSDTKLGIGLATGMFYHAPENTALPTTLSGSLAAAWTKVGDITQDGITLNTDKSVETLRNWALTVKRVIMTEHTETIDAPIMDTTQEVLETILGEDNVTVASNVITANLSAGSLPDPEAYLFLMKDGDDLMAIGCTSGQISALASVNFQPGGAIVWTPTITAMGDGFVFIME